jgi:hypothetical protein
VRTGSTPAVVILGCAVLATALTLVVTGDDTTTSPGATKTPPTARIVPTRPTELGPADVGRIAAALGIRGEPVAASDSWSATDPERSLVLQRGPDGWYALYTDSSVLLDPPTPETGLPAAVSEPAPNRTDAAATARSLLDRAGLLLGRWVSSTGAAAEMPAVCRPLPTPYDCNQIRLQTRHVVFVRMLGGRLTTIEWEVLVGPGGRILDAFGRIAAIGASR